MPRMTKTTPTASASVTDVPLLFDRDERARRRNRATPQFAGSAFLHDHVAEDFALRLSAIQRQFENVAILAAADGRYARALEPLPWFPPASLRQIEQAPALAAPGSETADPTAPPLRESEVDLLLFGLDLHACNDPVGTLIQCRRALRPDGLLLATLFGGETLHQLRVCLAEAEAAEEGGLSPRVFPMGDLRDLGALLQRAGFALPVADTETLTVWYESPLALMRDLRAMGETNVLTGRRRTALRRATLMRALEIYASRYARVDGKVPATFELVTLTGWAPSSAQQKPLRPGSASARLADALGVAEHPSGEKPGD